MQKNVRCWCLIRMLAEMLKKVYQNISQVTGDVSLSVKPNIETKIFFFNEQVRFWAFVRILTEMFKTVCQNISQVAEDSRLEWRGKTCWKFFLARYGAAVLLECHVIKNSDVKNKLPKHQPGSGVLQPRSYS